MTHSSARGLRNLWRRTRQNCDGADAPCIVQTGEIFEFSIVPAGEDGCRDLNGDGVPDNAFGILAGIINPSLEQEIAQGNISLFALAYGLETSDLEGRFELAVVYASRGRVADASLDENGRPINFFPGAEISRGALVAGPRPFTLELPLAGGVNLQLRAQEATISGQAVIPAMHAGLSGLQVNEGLLTAVYLKTSYEERLWRPHLISSGLWIASSQISISTTMECLKAWAYAPSSEFVQLRYRAYPRPLNAVTMHNAKVKTGAKQASVSQLMTRRMGANLESLR